VITILGPDGLKTRLSYIMVFTGGPGGDLGPYMYMSIHMQLAPVVSIRLAQVGDKAVCKYVAQMLQCGPHTDYTVSQAGHLVCIVADNCVSTDVLHTSSVSGCYHR